MNGPRETRTLDGEAPIVRIDQVGYPISVFGWHHLLLKTPPVDRFLPLKFDWSWRKRELLEETKCGIISGDLELFSRALLLLFWAFKAHTLYNTHVFFVFSLLGNLYCNSYLYIENHWYSEFVHALNIKNRISH